jgi:exoribonuclease II
MVSMTSRPNHHGNLYPELLSKYEGKLQCIGYGFSLSCYCRNSAWTHGITLGEVAVNGQQKIASLSSTGELWLHLPHDVMFDLPSVVQQDLALRCGTEVYSENDIQHNARVELLKRIRQLESALAEVQTSLEREMGSIYYQIRSSNPDEWAQTTVTEIAKILAPDKPLDFLTCFAIHKHVMRRYKEFVADPVAYRTSQMFYVRPISHVNRLRMIAATIHQIDSPVQAFARRARTVMAENQQRAKESFAEPHSEHLRDRDVFTKEDGIIINFLRDSIRAVRTIQTDPYQIFVSKIVKTIGGYKGEVNDTVVYQLLMDLGAIAPWQDIITAEMTLELEQEPEEHSSTISTHTAIVQRACTKLATASTSNGGVLGPEDFYAHDLLESVRHDFGNLPVYVIDDPGAEELDDGISVEKIPSEPDCAWIHVHIADPTAVLPPTHVFAEQARRKVATAYFGHRTWPMLPQSAMHVLIHSLGDMAAIGKPERVMSFSFKVDGTGDIVDYNVRAGIIRNVHRTTYDDVNRVLGETTNSLSYPFGGQPPPPPAMHLNEQQQIDIHTLDEVVDRMFQRTLKLPIFSISTTRAEISISPKPLYTNSVDPLRPPIFRGFPNLTYAVESYSTSVRGANRIVGQSMTAASRIASRWALDHGVPLLRRVSTQPTTLSDNDFADLLASRDKYGIVPLDIGSSKAIITPPAEYTLQPRSHWGLGIPDGEGYCRVTSPLRRYNDMVTHWQIKHALLHPTSSTPLFSPEWLQDYAKELPGRERYQRQALQNYTSFWALRFIQRWMRDHSRSDAPDPLSNLVAVIPSQTINNTVLSDVQARPPLPQLGLRGFLVGLKRNSVTPGEIRQVKIKEILVGARSKLILELK